MMCDPHYLEDFENMTLTDDGDVVMEPEVAESTSTDDNPLSTLEQARLEWSALVDQQPLDEARRARSGEVSSDTHHTTETPSSEVPPASEVVTVETSEELLEPPTADTLKEWMKRMFSDPGGVRLELPKLAAAFKPTNGLLVNAKQAVFELFGTKAFKAGVCCSPERPDLKLSQEEALGWLLAYARGRQLLTEEARPIGKCAGKDAGELKKDLDRIRDAAKVRRSKARSKKASAEEIAAIDTKAETDRTAIAMKEITITHMPAVNTVIVERRAPKPKPIDPHAPRIRALEAMFGSEVAWDAIDAAREIEDTERQLFFEEDCDENPIDHDKVREEIELALVRYKHKLARLKAAYPAELNDCSEDGSCAHRRQCPCGRGMRGAWPWVVQTPGRGFCELIESKRGEFYNDGEWSCDELHEERERWLWAYGWSSEAQRAKRLPNGECWLPEKRYREKQEALRRELYWSWRELGLS